MERRTLDRGRKDWFNHTKVGEVRFGKHNRSAFGLDWLEGQAGTKEWLGGW